MAPVLRSRSSQSPSPSHSASDSAMSSILKRKFPPEDHAPPFSDRRDSPPMSNDDLESNSIRNVIASRLERSNTAARNTTIMAENSVKVETSDVAEEGNINNSNSGNAAATEANGGSITGIVVKEETVKSIFADIIQTGGAYSAREESSQSEIVFKRPETINRQSIISTYYKVRVLEDVRYTLLSVGGQALLDRFVAGCFGHLIYWMPGQICGMAVHHVLSREIDMPGAENHEMWFHINGRNLRFSYPEYALITGLNFGSSTFSPAADHDLRNVEVFTRFCYGTQISVADLLARFSNTRAQIDDPDGDLYLRVAHILVLYLFLFGFDPRKYVEPWVWKLVDDLEVFDRFPWGAYTYLTLRHYVKNMRRTPKYHFNGPVWAFHIWCLEVIPDLATAVGTLVDMEARPRCMRWKLQSKPKLDLEPIFRLEVAMLTELVPDDDERNTFYWQSTQHSSALSVEYVEPRNLIKEGKPYPRHAPTTALISGVSCPIQEAPRTRRQQREASTYDDGESDPSVHASREMRRHGACTRDTGNHHRRLVSSSSSSDGEHHRQSHRRGARTRDTGKRHRKSISSSSSSDGEQHRRFIDRRWMDKYTDMLAEKLNKRLMPQFTKLFEDLTDAVRCGFSGRSPPFVPAPCPTPQSPIPKDVDRSREGHDVNSILARDEKS